MKMVTKYILQDVPAPGVWVKWPRIDTLNTNSQPQDLWPGNKRNNGITATLLPDPFQMVAGGYYLINGVTIDTIAHHPPLFYSDKGKNIFFYLMVLLFFQEAMKISLNMLSEG